MTNTDLKTRKFKMIEQIVQMDELAITKLESSLSQILNTSISVEDYNKELEEPVSEIEKGECLDHGSAVNRIQSWR